MIIVEDAWPGQPDEVWVRNIELSPVRQVQTKRRKWRLSDQTANLLEH
jgi:hypothetical protein